MTVPAQYPLTLNSLVSGANQKNNREPVTNLDENRVLDGIQGLRGKGLALIVDMAGSRVDKYRHNAREVLKVETSALVVLTELLLRGPQTVGELRTRASRMHALDSLEVVEGILAGLMEREQPLVKKIPPARGSRAERYVQLLCEGLHPLDAPGGSEREYVESPRVAAGAGREEVAALEARVASLEEDVARMKKILEDLGG